MEFAQKRISVSLGNPKASLSPALSQSILMLLKFLRHRDFHRVSAVKKPLKPPETFIFSVILGNLQNSGTNFMAHVWFVVPPSTWGILATQLDYKNANLLTKQRVGFTGSVRWPFSNFPSPTGAVAKNKKTVSLPRIALLNCKVKLAAPGSCCASFFARGVCFLAIETFVRIGQLSADFFGLKNRSCSWNSKHQQKWLVAAWLHDASPPKNRKKMVWNTISQSANHRLIAFNFHHENSQKKVESKAKKNPSGQYSKVEASQFDPFTRSTFAKLPTKRFQPGVLT